MNTERLPVTLNVNDERHDISVAVGDTLLDVLRDSLHLTGAKRGCNQGVCGACTVLADGEPIRACLALTVNCTDVEITTAEGLLDQGELSAVQQAFVDSGAVQCGFCTPGMVLAATALLNANAAPSVEEIRDGLSGNLCRCSGYAKIIEAVQLAGGG